MLRWARKWRIPIQTGSSLSFSLSLSLSLSLCNFRSLYLPFFFCLSLWISLFLSFISTSKHLCLHIPHLYLSLSISLAYSLSHSLTLTFYTHKPSLLLMSFSISHSFFTTHAITNRHFILILNVLQCFYLFCFSHSLPFL